MLSDLPRYRDAFADLRVSCVNGHDKQTYWLQRLANLRIDRSRGDPAPHKPFLLLVILEMADKGEITGDELSLSADLAFRFGLFNSVITDRGRAKLELRLPFHHLGTSGIWQPIMADGRASPHRDLTVRARFDPSFLACLREPVFREQAKRLLIATDPYFRPAERLSLYAMFGIKPEPSSQAREQAALYKASVERGREARFRIDVVVVAYKHTCALTGYRMTTVNMDSIVDAAHIHEFCNSRNNDAQNGIALCKNAHWQFDQGLWTIDAHYRVRVNPNKFVESDSPGSRLAGRDGQRLFLPDDRRYWPKQEHLEWHRKHKFSA